MAEVKWIKITTDIFDDEKMALIDAMPERDGIIVIWFKLLCMAGKQNNGGVFMLNDRIAYTDEMLATIFRRPLNTVRLALSTLEQFGMIDIVNNAYTIPNWEKHQSLDKLEIAKEKNRLRVAKHREKQKMLTQCNDYGNVTVTDCNATEEDKEKKEDKNKNKSNKKAVALDGIINDYTDNEFLKNVILEFIKMRKTIKAPMTDNAVKLMLNKLDKLASNDDEKIAILNQSIMNSWKGIFELKDNKPQYNQAYQQAQQAQQGTGNIFLDMYNERQQKGACDV